LTLYAVAHYDYGKARGGILILPDWAAAAEQVLLARPSAILVSASAKFDDL